MVFKLMRFQYPPIIGLVMRAFLKADPTPNQPVGGGGELSSPAANCSHLTAFLSDPQKVDYVHISSSLTKVRQGTGKVTK